jgi:hypothetical protein
MDQSHQGGKLFHLDGAHSKGSTQTLSIIRQNSERTHETTVPERQINKVKQNAPDNPNKETHQNKPSLKLKDVQSLPQEQHSAF